MPYLSLMLCKLFFDCILRWFLNDLLFHCLQKVRWPIITFLKHISISKGLNLNLFWVGTLEDYRGQRGGRGEGGLKQLSCPQHACAHPMRVNLLMCLIEVDVLIFSFFFFVFYIQFYLCNKYQEYDLTFLLGFPLYGRNLVSRRCVTHTLPVVLGKVKKKHDTILQDHS